MSESNTESKKEVDMKRGEERDREGGGTADNMCRHGHKLAHRYMIDTPCSVLPISMRTQGKDFMHTHDARVHTHV